MDIEEHHPGHNLDVRLPLYVWMCGTDDRDLGNLLIADVETTDGVTVRAIPAFTTPERADAFATKHMEGAAQWHLRIVRTAQKLGHFLEWCGRVQPVLLDGYWPSFLEENVSLHPEAMAAAPKPQRREPPKETPRTGLLDRLKGIVPRF